VSRPDDIAGKAFFVTNSLNEQATAYAQVRQAFIKRRTLPTPVKVTILPPAVRAAVRSRVEDAAAPHTRC